MAGKVNGRWRINWIKELRRKGELNVVPRMREFCFGPIGNIIGAPGCCWEKGGESCRDRKNR